MQDVLERLESWNDNKNSLKNIIFFDSSKINLRFQILDLAVMLINLDFFFKFLNNLNLLIKLIAAYTEYSLPYYETGLEE